MRMHYCDRCKENTYTVVREEMTSETKDGVTYSYMKTTPYCKVCGAESWDGTLYNQNLIKANLAFNRVLHSTR